MDLRQKVREVKYKMSDGLSYEEAKKELQPYLDDTNKKGQQIAKKYKKHFKKLTFSYVIR